MSFNRLYLIEILHQTTTYIRCELILLSCILSKFYIKPQQRVRHKLGHSCCILSKFYIKPQLGVDRHLGAFVVSYRNSTSNHNPTDALLWRGAVVSYRNSTSNHNEQICWSYSYLLYLIEILHQTTTCYFQNSTPPSCILSKFYIKPQQRIRHKIGHSCCILSKFYIKPQRHPCLSNARIVVSYRNSTSNHNTTDCRTRCCSVVSYRNSTSNHNLELTNRYVVGVVSYRNSTSNHNFILPFPEFSFRAYDVLRQ